MAIVHNLLKGKFFLLLACLAVFSVPSVFSQQLERFEYSQSAMGTVFQIILYSDDADLADQAANAAFAKIGSLNLTMSDYLPDSEVSLLTKTAGKGKKSYLSEDLWAVLFYAQKVSANTDGAFDVTVGPLSQLWRKAFKKKAFPSKRKTDRIKNRVGYKNIELIPEENAVILKKKKMRIDLGGIAKGYAADEAFRVCNSLGVNIVLIDAGGDIRVGDPPPEKEGWAIEFPVKAGCPKEMVYLENAAIATSGDKYKFLESKGKRYSHIIDPRTGIGLTHQTTVTVISKNAMAADAYASAISVIGDLDNLSKKNDLYARIIDPTKDDCEIRKSGELNHRTVKEQ